MGNSGGSSTPAVVPATPMPIENDISKQAEAAQIVASRAAGASRTANNLDEPNANKQEAVTRSQLGMGATLAPQPRPKGPQGGQGPRGPAPGTAMGGGIGNSAVLTG